MDKSRTERYMKERRRRRQSMLLGGLMLGLVALLLLGIAGGIALLFTPRTPPEAAPPVPAEPAGTPPEDVEVTLHFVGDVMMAGRVGDLLEEKGYDYPYTHVRSLFQTDDYTVANLETPVTNRGVPASNKQYVYKSSPKAITPMRKAGVDLVNLANNHIMDQGESGLLDTLAFLRQNQVAYVGAGADAAEAYAPHLVERNGLTIAFLGFSRVVPHVSWYAGDGKPGVAATYDPALALEAIKQARTKADLVVVIAHWGREKEDFPVDYQRSLAKRYIDAGADLVVGGHPHVLQGLESYRGKWIAYSLGNFIFTRSPSAKTWETMILQATCRRDGSCRLRMHPFWTELGQAVPMIDTDAARLRKRVESISTQIQIDPEGWIIPSSAGP